MSELNLNTGPHWKGDDDGRPKFGRKALVWLEHRLRDYLTIEQERAQKKRKKKSKKTVDYSGSAEWEPIPPDVVEEMIRWYMEQPELYVRWQSADTYQGKGYSAGGWVLSDRVSTDAGEAHTEAKRAVLRAADAAMITTLDDWLRADIADSLQYDGAAGGSEDLPRTVQMDLLTAANRRRATWPSRCIECDELFKPHRGKQRRCGSCLAARKAMVSK